MKPEFLLLGAVVVAGLAGVYLMNSQPENAVSQASEATAGAPLVSVIVPQLSGKAQIGEKAFAVKCAVCHGENAAGKNGNGPPLIHRIYEPGHHGDAAFLMAVRNGVRSHHWPFGDMAPVDGLTDGDVGNIVAYVRALQVANGIQ